MDINPDGQKLDELFRTVAAQMGTELAAFAQSLRSGTPDAAAVRGAYDIAHRLHGAGTPYGYPAVTEMGASLERIIEAVKDGALAVSPALSDLIEACAAALRDLNAPDRAGQDCAARFSRLAWQCECVLHAPSSADSVADPPARTAPHCA